MKTKKTLYVIGEYTFFIILLFCSKIKIEQMEKIQDKYPYATFNSQTVKYYTYKFQNLIHSSTLILNADLIKKSSPDSKMERLKYEVNNSRFKNIKYIDIHWY